MDWAPPSRLAAFDVDSGMFYVLEMAEGGVVEHGAVRLVAGVDVAGVGLKGVARLLVGQGQQELPKSGVLVAWVGRCRHVVLVV